MNTFFQSPYRENYLSNLLGRMGKLINLSESLKAEEELKEDYDLEIEKAAGLIKLAKSLGRDYFPLKKKVEELKQVYSIE